MKTMKIQEQNKKNKRRIKVDAIIFALIFIAVGVLFIARNTGLIEQSVFNIFMSWQMLLVMIGLYFVSHRGHLIGTIVAGIGVFFMMPLLTGAGSGWLSTYWPVVFVFIGLLVLIKTLFPGKKKVNKDCDNMTIENRTEDGFVNSNNVFSGTKHVILDEVFKGAAIHVTCGGSVLDLRHTTIEDGETYIDIECVLGGVEVYVSNEWLVLTEISPILGGIEDERQIANNNNNDNKKLVLRGKVTLGGVVLKN